MKGIRRLSKKPLVEEVICYWTALAALWNGFGDEVLSADEGCGLRTPGLCRSTVKKHTRLACKPCEVEAWLA